ncbi:MAG: zinc-dependent peptidase, partial [Burkholderiales bacterium]|nr:zinc-dependent peptidase [Burkholderiales bacterium]
MFGGYRAWRRRRVLQRKTIDAVLWAHVSSRFGFVNRLSKSDQIRLRELCLLFLHEKQI